MPCDSNSAPHELTRQFYAWEMRGRGWQTYPWPVALEPPFRTFIGHYLSRPAFGSDDGRKPTFLSSFFDRITPCQAEPPPGFFSGEPYEPEPEPFAYPAPIAEIQVT